MAEPQTKNSSSPSAPLASAAAYNGRQIARSVVANWIWYALVILIGFLIPRFIDRKLGREVLGIWDLSWSLVIYVRWLQLGIGASINRHVALHRAAGDWRALNEAVNSSMAVLLVPGLVGLAGGIVLAHAVGVVLPGLAADALATARTVVVLLTTSVVLDFLSSAVNSVITGCNRFDVLNFIRGARDVLVAATVIVLVTTGGGIVAVACVHLVGSAICLLIWIMAAKRVCPQLRLSLRFCRWAAAREMVRFGSKSVLQAGAQSALYQANSILVGYFMGPAALAIFSRQRALVLQVFSVVKHYAYVFIPESSALQARGDMDSQKRLLKDSSRYGLYVTLPMMLILLLMGGPLLNVWMGPGYEAPVVLAILALGHLLPVAQYGAYMVLVGMNRHGPPAAFDLIAAVASVLLAALFLGVLRMELPGAALAISLPVLLCSGIVTPRYACQQVGLGVYEYLRSVLPGPVLTNVPLALCLSGARLAWPSAPWVALLAGLGVGAAVTSFLYWRTVLPASLRRRATERLRTLFSRNREPSKLSFDSQ